LNPVLNFLFSCVSTIYSSNLSIKLAEFLRTNGLRTLTWNSFSSTFFPVRTTALNSLSSFSGAVFSLRFTIFLCFLECDVLSLCADFFVCEDVLSAFSGLVFST